MHSSPLLGLSDRLEPFSQLFLQWKIIVIISRKLTICKNIIKCFFHDFACGFPNFKCSSISFFYVSRYVTIKNCECDLLAAFDRSNDIFDIFILLSFVDSTFFFKIEIISKTTFASSFHWNKIMPCTIICI